MRNILIIICILASFYIDNSLSQANKACLTPDRLEGTCLAILECPPLWKTLNNLQRSERETKHLQQSKCDRVGDTVYVCCHIETESRLSPSTENLLPSPEHCGRSFKGKIHGGNVTRIGEYPWVVLIEYTIPGRGKSFHCGGALINNRYVLTAAHCINGRKIPRGVRATGVRLGEWDRSTTEDCEISITGEKDCADPHVDIDIEEAIVHPSYNPRSSTNLHDIALLRLKRSVAFTNFISPVCLPTQTHLRTKTFEGTKMDVTGWGSTENSTFSNLKLKATIEVWRHEACRQKYATGNYIILDTQMCAGGQEGVDSCDGDSGGPLVGIEKIDGNEVYVVTGVVSFGPAKCGKSGVPGVYTRVGPYADWIINTVRA